MLSQELEMTKKMQAEFHNFLRSIMKRTIGIRTPKRRFIKDMVFGMLCSGSPIVRKIAQKLKSNVCIKSVCKRLYENLSQKGIAETLRKALLEDQCRHINQDSIIILDGSDIAKPEAKKMEGLSYVHDGSQKRQVLGYDVLNIFAYAPEEEGYKMLPLSTYLYSNKKELQTKTTIELNWIKDISEYAKKKGIYLYDRGGDTRTMLGHLSRYGLRYAICSTGRRGIIMNDKEIPFKKAAAKVRLRYEMPGRNNGNKLLCGAKWVKLRISPHSKKDAITIRTWLVVVQKISKRGKKGKKIYFFSNFQDYNLTDGQIVKKTLDSYRLRWKIEESHRQIKIDQNWEAMRLMSYEGLKNLNMLVFLAASFVYSLKKLMFQLVEAYPGYMIDKKSDVKRLPKIFIFYRLFNVVKECFRQLSIRRPVRYKSICEDAPVLGLVF